MPRRARPGAAGRFCGAHSSPTGGERRPYRSHDLSPPEVTVRGAAAVTLSPIACRSLADRSLVLRAFTARWDGLTHYAVTVGAFRQNGNGFATGRLNRQLVARGADLKYPWSGFAGHGVVGWGDAEWGDVGWGVLCGGCRGEVCDGAERCGAVWSGGVGGGWLPVLSVDASACTPAPSCRVSRAAGLFNGSEGRGEWTARPRRLSEAAAVTRGVPPVDGFVSARILKQPVTR